MRRCYFYFLLFMFTGLLCGQANRVLAKNPLPEKNRELKRVNVQIIGLQQDLLQSKHQRKDLQQQLKRIEIAIGLSANALHQTNDNLTNQRQILAGLRAQQQDFQRQRQQQQQILGEEVRSAYMLGKHQYVKLLLNQQDPNTLSRLIEYYRYINRARLKAIQQLNQTLLHLTANQQQIEQHTLQLKKLLQTQQHQQQNLQQKFKRRQRILVQLNARIQTKSQHLKELLEDKRALTHLIKRLKRQQMVFQQPIFPFKDMRHRLPWPTRGEIVKGFNDPIESSGLRYNAVFINAPVGQAIKAIFPGKVVFANWLRGVGLLVIVNHGHGYMTLYGHCHRLLVKAGEVVTAGQTIATVGESGGYENSGLYFQIRDNGKPENPRIWCR